MNIYLWLLDLCWLVFLGYWLVAAWHTKKTIWSGRSGQGFIVRLVALIVVLWLLQASRASLPTTLFMPTTNSTLSVLGVLICAGGIALAIRARRHLGQNWGMPMSVKENPDLVTSGP